MAAIENLVRYADLRLLIDINAPEFDYDAAVGSVSRERVSCITVVCDITGVGSVKWLEDVRRSSGQ